MEDNTAKSPKDEREKPEEVEATAAEAPPPHKEDGGGGGGWGGWGFSPFSVFSDLQKAATVAAEEISRNVSLSLSLSFSKCTWIVLFGCGENVGFEKGLIFHFLGLNACLGNEYDIMIKMILLCFSELT